MEEDKDYDAIIKRLKAAKDALGIVEMTRDVYAALKTSSGIKKRLLYAMLSALRGLDYAIDRVMRLSGNHMKKISLEVRRLEAIRFDERMRADYESRRNDSKIDRSRGGRG